MSKWQKLLDKMRQSAGSIRFDELARVCDHYFGNPRQAGTSHRIYRTPWQGDPRINIQRTKNGKVKHYQVMQVLEAIDKLEATSNG